MEIEQTKPNQPNFGLIVGLFCATIVVVLLLAVLFLHVEGGSIHLRHHTQHPTSQLALPAITGRLA